MREFVYLADTLSFKRTADYFYVSRSVISRHLSALEEALGAKLVERSSHAVSLTDAGETFYRDAVTILRDYEMALEHVRISQSNQAKIVRIGYLRNTARPIIVQFVRYMKKRHPSIVLSLSCMEYNELRCAIDEGTVDIAFGINVDPSISRNYRSTLIYNDQFYAMVGEDNPLAQHRAGVRLADLPEDKLLLPDSFIHTGHIDMAGSFDDLTSQTTARNHEHYFDIDAIYLKIQTEDYIVLSSKANSSVFGEHLVCLPILDIDSTFSVSAFYRNGFTGETFKACRDAFEFCSEIKAAKR